MNNHERIQLENMIKEHDVVDNTNLIRNLKHSLKIYEDVNKMLNLKKTHKKIALENPKLFDEICTTNCSFIFNNYTDIYNKVLKDEIDLDILLQLINTLKHIEEGNLNQHEGSFEVGKLLKQIYIDSALKKEEKLNNKEDLKSENSEKVEPVNISWKEYKQKNL
jgi:hypothetical protein